MVIDKFLTINEITLSFSFYKNIDKKGNFLINSNSGY